MLPLPKAFSRCLAVFLLWAPQAASASAASDAGEVEEFRSMLLQFVPAWDAEDLENLHRFVDPEIGFWVVYSLGILEVPNHYSDLESLFGKEWFGARINQLVGFNGCRPSPGPAPTCEPDGIREAECHCGSGPPTYLEKFDRLLEVFQASDLPSLRADRALLESASGETIYYVSDSRWGAVFFFSNISGHWRLLVLDLSDCSA